MFMAGWLVITKDAPAKLKRDLDAVLNLQAELDLINQHFIAVQKVVAEDTSRKVRFQMTEFSQDCSFHNDVNYYWTTHLLVDKMFRRRVSHQKLFGLFHCESERREKQVHMISTWFELSPVSPVRRLPARKMQVHHQIAPIAPPPPFVNPSAPRLFRSVIVILEKNRKK